MSAGGQIALFGTVQGDHLSADLSGTYWRLRASLRCHARQYWQGDPARQPHKYTGRACILNASVMPRSGCPLGSGQAGI
jgi:hypothetical protein